MFLWDIISLSMRTHSMASCQQYWQVTPYACVCVREVMIMLVHLMSHRQVALDKQSFWAEVTTLLSCVLQNDENNNPALEETDSDVFSVPPNYACADPGDFCWWFLITSPLSTRTMSLESHRSKLVHFL
ncbi:hypothetical protein NP493_71g05059 [Ridgeia piscesae]|uniref:Protein MMS22-like N-terminal domain-containing protein n=1 Tax=Ridgeia piscesae TaxID=27915 RepID=A0AAD9P9L3_RIDPI|nr:hypothetical protein NP493_71g05059 [Ridgeia piscesae]